ncbi:DUF5050 domain-containing protein [Flavobacteriaceae bacterium S356]|uniref:DUF5050 domain-containing protein n=1 Tax=Asprobacillus argus TaxID=3076534 RepID=A0ABU3LDL2_9FLAO|nr:DUF5050 domain-containing protein [Flavobacteriaceae bacterium S356]
MIEKYIFCMIKNTLKLTKMKNKNMKYIKIVSFFLTLLTINGYCQSSKESTSYTIAFSSTESGDVGIYQRNTDGKSAIKSTNKKGGYLAWSPDGKQFAFYHKYDEKKTWSIHTMNSDGSNRKRLTHEKYKWDNSPAWSPDGTKIVFARAYKDTDNNWQHEIWIMNSDGTNQKQIEGLEGGGPYFTSDDRIIFHSQPTPSEIFITNMDGSNQIQLTHNEAEDWHPEVSPDGKQIAFMSNRDGNHEIYVMNIDGSNQKRLTNNSFDDWYPSWSPDGSQIIFSSLRNGEKSIYRMNKDGSSVRKIIPNATSPAWLKIRTQQNYIEAPEATTVEVKGSFRDIPKLKKAYIEAAPMDRKDGISVGELGVDGGNKEMILTLARRIAGNQYGIYDSFLIAHKGRLLFESYYTRGRINLAHPQASATKTYTGLLLGRAIQLGYLTMADLDKPLTSFLKDLDPSKFIENVGKTTLHQALTMTTGIRVSEENREKMRKNPERLKGQGEVQALFEYSDPITPESKLFRYSAGPALVMQVIDAVVPGTAKDFIKNEFLDKMGITNYDWPTAPSGLPQSGWRISITSRDMIKIGIMALNKGTWKGEQLIPEAFIARATSKVVSSGENAIYFGGAINVSNEGYGYLMWNAELEYENKNYFTANAQGGGGQFIILIEELDLVIVTTGHNNRYPSTLRMTAEQILPAFIKQ